MTNPCKMNLTWETNLTRGVRWNSNLMISARLYQTLCAPICCYIVLKRKALSYSHLKSDDQDSKADHCRHWRVSNFRLVISRGGTRIFELNKYTEDVSRRKYSDGDDIDADDLFIFNINSFGLYVVTQSDTPEDAFGVSEYLEGFLIRQSVSTSSYFPSVRNRPWSQGSFFRQRKHRLEFQKACYSTPQGGIWWLKADFAVNDKVYVKSVKVIPKLNNGNISGRKFWWAFCLG